MNNIEEQPNTSPNVDLMAVEPDEKENEQTGEKGSLLLKFKSVDELCKAYENLEKEFTKKCQQLSTLDNENNCDNVDETPQYERETWNEKVSSFIKENELAKNYTKEISEQLLTDTELSKKDDALSLAFLRVLQKNFKTEKDLIASNEFLENYIYNNEEIKTKIIEKYLNDISLNKTVPLITNFKGTNGILASNFKPKNIAEAGRYAETMFKK